MKTDTGKNNKPRIYFGSIFQTERRTRKEPALNTSGEINPKNGQLLRGFDGKYGRWDEILRDKLNVNLKIVQNRKAMDSDTEDDDDDDVEDDEEMPEETGTPKVYDTSERDGRYAPIRTNKEEDALQIHTDDEISAENFKTNKDDQTEILNNRIDTAVYHTPEILGLETYNVYIT